MLLLMKCPVVVITIGRFLFFSIRVVTCYVNLYQILAICSERFYSVFSMEYRYLVVFLAQNAQDG